MMIAAPANAVIPADGVHPAFNISEVGLSNKYHTMGIGFLSDGRMVILTTGIIGGGEVPNPDPGSAVFLVSGLDGKSPITASMIANMFRQPSGVNVVSDKIYVSDRDAFYSINHNDATTDPTTNHTKIIDWPMGSHWHQWVFTPMYNNGKFYAPYSGSIRLGGPSDVPASTDYSGAFLSWDPDGKNMTKFAGGLRSPNGAGMNDAGDMFVMDNQGSWLPGCTFMHMKQGKFYGHRQTPPNAPNWAESLPYQPPAVWIPYPSQVAGASNSQPVYMSKGPYAGQWIAGDDNGPGLIRLALEKVNGDYQGTVFRFSNGTSTSGINRLAWGPDGALYMGSMEHFGNWPGNGLMPFYKLTAKAGGSAFEMLAIHSYQNGMEIEFTKPVAKTLSAADFTVKQWHYTRGSNYGCCQDATENRTVSGVQISDDGTRVFLQIAGLKAMDYVIYFKLGNIKPATGSDVLWDNEAWYTLNNISTLTWTAAIVNVAQRREPDSPLSRQIQAENMGRGGIRVSVDNPNAYTLSLRSLDGALLAEKSGSGRGQYLLIPGKNANGLLLLEIRQGSQRYTRTVVY